MKAAKQQVARKALAKDSEAPATGNGAMLFGMLWCLAILVFGVGDLLTSSLAYGLGAVEGNPILRSMMGTFGDGIWPLLYCKRHRVECSLRSVLQEPRNLRLGDSHSTHLCRCLYAYT